MTSQISTATGTQLAQLSVAADALTFAFKDARGGCYQFDKLPYHTQTALENALARIIRRGTNDLMASATAVVENWITG